MQNDTGRERDTGGEAFGKLDARLNIYALANGMDLIRAPTVRRLEWHKERLERGILLEADEEGLIGLSALAWNFGDPASVRRVKVGESLDPDALERDLTDLLQRTLEAADAL